MDEKIICPLCGSTQVRLWEELVKVQIVSADDGGPGVERICRVYRCLSCGRNFDEVEAEEGPESEKCQ